MKHAQLRQHHIDAHAAEVCAATLPAWEAVYEPGNVSDYLIGYCNDEAPAKAAAETWLHSQKDEVGRLEWVSDALLAVDEYDVWLELAEHHDDGIPTGPGLIVRHRAPAPPGRVPSRAETAAQVRGVDASLRHVDDLLGAARPDDTQGA